MNGNFDDHFSCRNPEIRRSYLIRGRYFHTLNKKIII
jgi:hypothetical protein